MGPTSLWLDDTPPESPEIDVKTIADTLKVSWTHKNKSDIFHWIIYYQYDNFWEYRISNRTDETFLLPISRLIVKRKRGQEEPEEIIQDLEQIAVSAVDRTGNESALIIKKIKVNQNR